MRPVAVAVAVAGQPCGPSACLRESGSVPARSVWHTCGSQVDTCVLRPRHTCSPLSAPASYKQPRLPQLSDVALESRPRLPTAEAGSRASAGAGNYRVLKILSPGSRWGAGPRARCHGSLQSLPGGAGEYSCWGSRPPLRFQDDVCPRSPLPGEGQGVRKAVAEREAGEDSGGSPPTPH